MQNTRPLFPAAHPRDQRCVEIRRVDGPSAYDGNASDPGAPRPRAHLRVARFRQLHPAQRVASSSSNQIIFQAGPKGGQHGHNDLLGFELSGYGKPLISEPGLVNYSGDADEIYAESTPAANTISADGLNDGDIEGVNNPAIAVDAMES